MNQAEVMAALDTSGAVRQGHFLLSSGRHGDVYIQCAQALQNIGLAERLGHELGDRLRKFNPTLVLSPAMGGLIIGHETARHLDVRSIFSERVDGQMTLRRGFEIERSDRVVVIEDVVTTGRSPKETIKLIEAAGAECVGVGSIVDRTKESVGFGVPFESLVKVEADTWQPNECPNCVSGSEAVAPGSRHLTS